MANIPFSRLCLYLFLAGLLPILLSAWSFLAQKSNLDALKENIQTLEARAYLQEKKQGVNQAVRLHFKDADHFYIDKFVETISLLEHEIEGLQKITQHPHFTEDDNIKKRLELLTSPGNHLTFSEGVVQSTPVFQETVETLVHPVEVNVNDLANILAKIEGVDIGSYTPGPNRPQLIILDFKLEKKNISDKNQVFLLNMKLLKREFL